MSREQGTMEEEDFVGAGYPVFLSQRRKERKARKGRKKGVCILSALVNYSLRLLT